MVECSECEYFFGEDMTTITSLEACDDLGELCIELTQAEINDFTILVNGNPYMGNIITCSTSPDNVALQLPVGTHTIDITNNIDNCGDVLTATVECEACDFFFGQSTSESSNAEACEGPVELCIGVSNADIANFDILLDGMAYTGNVSECSTDANVLSIDLEAGEHTVILVDNVLGCSDTLEVNVECSDCDYFFGDTEVLIELTENCDEGAEYCIDIPFEDLNNYEITVNAMTYDGDIGQCMIDTVSGYNYADIFGQGNDGPYEITSWMVNDTTLMGNFDDIPELIALMNMLDPNGNWEVVPNTTFIIGGDATNMYGDLTVNQTTFNLSSPLGFVVGFDPMGFTVALDTGFHQIVITNLTTGCSDAVDVTVSCSALAVSYTHLTLPTILLV